MTDPQWTDRPTLDQNVPRFSPQLYGQSPWGTILEVEAVQPGVTFVVTGRHGGYHLTPAANEAIPVSVRHEDGWYERDVAAALCARFVPFPDADPAYVALVLERYYPDLDVNPSAECTAPVEKTTRAVQ
ncbi:hypothetical protein GO986_12075 [Deinococcus sp. HMF7620]|uniref:DUF7007 domain-containing protein n=1 Tax=Deinococcus arboris TaxID=2682977 RepID=A0A7C9M2F4_9DEIO|nr:MULTISPECIES: hypothetical protein [Deinococcus]MBZ9752146.1 hypothetical protein [Deinococcus betulae]MVN87502.1 hypothetical protein [Deinococcus arboris]